MCIVAFSWNPDSETPLLLAANRDEFFERPTQAMHWWPNTDVLAGRDLKSGGAWLGVTRSGRFAMITNIRNPALRRADAPSRGELAREFLEGNASPADFAHAANARKGGYEGFNLLCGEVSPQTSDMWFLNSTESAPRQLGANLYALSNATLDTPWPKLTRIKQGFRHALAEKDIQARDERLLRLLHNTTQPRDDQLPVTGVPPDWERVLGSIFIRSETYGTRASTLVRLHPTSGQITEISHQAHAASAERRDFTLRL